MFPPHLTGVVCNFRARGRDHGGFLNEMDALLKKVFTRIKHLSFLSVPPEDILYQNAAWNGAKRKALMPKPAVSFDVFFFFVPLPQMFLEKHLKHLPSFADNFQERCRD